MPLPRYRHAFRWNGRHSAKAEIPCARLYPVVLLILPPRMRELLNRREAATSHARREQRCFGRPRRGLGR
jgi:hypothetical protein